MVLGIQRWEWPWPGSVFFGILAVGWVILLLVVAAAESKYDDIAEIELDVGYIQKVEQWKQYYADGEDSYVVNQRIVLAETAPPDGLNQRIYGTYDKTFEIEGGDFVILVTGFNGRVSNLMKIPFPTQSLPGASGKVCLATRRERR